MGRKLSRTWRFTDVNYKAASEDDRRDIFLSYCGVLNSLPTDASAKVTICNRRLDPEVFRRTVLMGERGDRLDLYRREFNKILLDKMAQGNDLIQDKFITCPSPSGAWRAPGAFSVGWRGIWPRASSGLDSGARPLSGEDRLRVLHDFFRPGEGAVFLLRPEPGHPQMGWISGT